MTSASRTTNTHGNRQILALGKDCMEWIALCQVAIEILPAQHGLEGAPDQASQSRQHKARRPRGYRRAPCEATPPRQGGADGRALRTNAGGAGGLDERSVVGA